MISRTAFWLGLLLSLPLALTGCNNLEPTSASSSAQEQNLTINKSPNDDRQYSAMVLPNGMQAVLVTDPSSEVAAVSLAVGVGSYQDPDAQLGLAHYLEHMLFLGTEKYPEPNSFQKFVDGNAGVWNAYTAEDHTNFFFQLKADQLDQALDYFSDYFKSPTFDAKFADKERNAVNSEWSMGRTNDSWILHRIGGLTSNPAHPAHRLTVGNLETLSDKPESTLQEALRDFYKRYYSANIMKLTIVSNQPQDVLRSLAEKHFASVPSREIKRPEISVAGLTKVQQGEHIYVKSLKDLKQLFIEFPIADNTAQWPVKPNEYLHYLISSEEPGTLGQQLREQGLVHSVAANVAPDEYGHDGTFTVFIEMTDMGMANQDRIISAVFAYIELMRTQGVDQRYFRELKAMWEKDFANQEKLPPLQQAMSLSTKQFDYPVQHLLDADYVYERFNAKAIQAVLDQLTPARARIWHVSNKEITDQPVPYYEGSYRVADFTKAELAAWQQQANSLSFSLPPENDLFTDKPAPLVDAVYKKPQLLVDQKGIEAWLVHNEFYREDKGFIELNVNIDFAANSITNLISANLLNDIFKTRQTTLIDKAGRAGIYISIDLSAEKGQLIDIYGYTEKQPQLLDQLVRDFAQLQVSDEDFAKALDRYVLALANNKKAIPVQQAFSEFGRMIAAKGGWSDEELIAAAKKMTPAHVQDYHRQVLANNLSRFYAGGNYTDAAVKQMATSAAVTLRSSRMPAQRYFSSLIPLTSEKLLTRTGDVEPTDNPFVKIYLDPEKTPQRQAQLQLLNGLFSTDFFTQLRTNEQLGYVVSRTSAVVNDHPLFAMYVQSTNTELPAINARINRFCEDYLAQLKALDAAKLEQLKAAEIAQLTQKPNDAKADATRHLRDFKEGKFTYDRKPQMIDALGKVTHQDLVSIYQQLVLEHEATRVIIQKRGSRYAQTPFAKIP